MNFLEHTQIWPDFDMQYLSRCHLQCLARFLDKLKARDFKATSFSTYDFSFLYTSLPHNLIKDKLTDLIEIAFN